MTVTQKTLSMIVAAFLLVGGASYFLQQRFVLAGFERIELAAVETSLQGVEMTLQREMSLFETFAADWGNWTETYEYMLAPQATFIEENLNQATFDANSLDMVALLDPESNFVWATGLDPATRVARRYALISGEHLDPGSPYRTAVAGGQPMRGIVNTELGPAMVVVAPILDGAGGGPHRGAVLLARVITDDVVATIGDQVRVSLAMEVLARDLKAPLKDQRLESRIQTSADQVVATAVVRDVAGHPTFRLGFAKPRDILHGGREAVRFTLVSLTLIGLVVLLTVLTTLRRLVLTPVDQVREFVRDVRTSGDLSLRLNLDRRDEFGEAAKDLNDMVERLAVAQRDAADKSFEAGLGEMARGVLHNIGNALTPLTVHAGRLEDDLTALPTRDFAVATDELLRPDLEQERRTKLLDFLQLASDDLQLRVSEAAQRAGSVLRGLAAVQSILQQQSSFANSTHVLERVTPLQIVEHGLRIVAPTKLKQLQVRLDDSLESVGPLRLPRIVLEQVAQNLIVNACEATIPGRRGSIEIAARIDDTPAGPALHMTFRDDGRGIDPDDLTRIFRKGFSTKGTDANSGLGLHWCGNVVHGFGGSVYAESPGPGRGATFHVRLPLQSLATDGEPQRTAA